MTVAQSPVGPRQPRRVLILSALMGGGHNAAARAVEETVRSTWPGCEVDRADALELAGPGVGPVLRQLYVTNIQRTPALYRFFYASLWRQRWFAGAAKTSVGIWFARALAPVIDRTRPDLIVSTYPMASAGLDWLRRRGRLPVATAALVCDIAPHPFWIYKDVDVNLVIHPMAVPLAVAAAPGARIEVCDLPVISAFHPAQRRAVRRGLGIREDAYVVLLSCGSYGFGAIDEAASALLAAGERVQAVVICGHNPRIARRLSALRQPPHRLLQLSWVDDMAALTRAADLVVTNAGGATALEALASGCRLVMYRPIAAHGEANAALFTAAALADTYRSAQQLTTAVRTLAAAGAIAEASPPQAQHSIADALRDLALRSAPAATSHPLPARGRAGTTAPARARPRHTRTRTRPGRPAASHLPAPRK